MAESPYTSTPSPRSEPRREARHEGREASEQAGEAAREAGAAVEARARSFADDQKRAAADQMHELAEALRSTARELHGSGGAATLAPYVERAAEGVDGASRRLREGDARSLLARAEDFARRQPTAFLGASVALGFGLARFLKSSGERPHAPASQASPGAQPSEPSSLSTPTTSTPL